MDENVQISYADNPLAANPKWIPVPVIASFDKEGKIRPLYFRYQGLRLKVDNIRYIKEDVTSRTTFVCEITLSDRVEPVVLSYQKFEQMWVIEKLQG